MNLEFIKWNPFASAFDDAQMRGQKKEEEMVASNSQGYTKEQLDSLFYTGNYDNAVFTDMSFQQYFDNKKQRIGFYRCMSNFPEITDALDWISDDAILEDDDGISAKLKIKNAEDVPRNVREKIYKAFEYIRDDIYRFNINGWKLFNDWLIDSELFMEIVLNSKKNNIIAVKKLPPFTMIPIYDGGVIKGFQQNLEQENLSYTRYNDVDKTRVNFAPNQIAYSNYGKFGGNLYDVRGYLEPAIRPYNQYKALQDALIIYRLVNAPERKVWNVDVGRMPKGKAEEYMRGLINRYKRKDIYDPETGAVNSAQNMKAINQDYWFARNEEGKGTTVETIGGQMELGNLDDVKIFRQTLFQVLKLPRSRWDESSTYSSGKLGEIEREEVKFSNFITRLQNQFKPILLDPLMVLLKLRGIDEKYLDKDMYDISFTKSNLFADYKEMDLLGSRFDMLQSASSYIATPDNVTAGNAFFAKEFVLKKYFDMSDQDYIDNAKMLEADIAKIKAENPPEDEMGGDTEIDTETDMTTDTGAEMGSESEVATTEEPDTSNLSPIAKAKQAMDDLTKEESVKRVKKYAINEGLKHFINNYKV